MIQYKQDPETEKRTPYIQDKNIVRRKETSLRREAMQIKGREEKRRGKVIFRNIDKPVSYDTERTLA